METTLQRIGDTLAALRDAVVTAWADGAWSPENWPPTLAWWLLALAVLLMLAALRRGRPRPLDVRPPQLLITQGEVVPDPDTGPPTRRRRANDPSGAQAGTLAMTVSNLSRYPVQLLEVALRGESRGAPRVAEVEAVVPAMGAVEVATRLPLDLQGDGWLDLYCYAAAPRHKTHRHRAELVWEPWAARFKVAPMEQIVTPVRRLASDERSARFDLPAEPGEATPVASAVTVAASPVTDPRPAPVVAPPPVSKTSAPTPPASVASPSGAPAAAEPARRTPVPTGASRATDGDAALDKGGGVARAADPDAAGGERPSPSLGVLWSRLPRRLQRLETRAPLETRASDAETGEGGEPGSVPLARAGASSPHVTNARTAAPPAGEADAVAPAGPAVRARRRLEFPDEF